MGFLEVEDPIGGIGGNNQLGRNHIALVKRIEISSRHRCERRPFGINICIQNPHQSLAKSLVQTGLLNRGRLSRVQDSIGQEDEKIAVGLGLPAIIYDRHKNRLGHFGIIKGKRAAHRGVIRASGGG